MKTTKLPTVDELNAAQAEWMALDSLGPKAEIIRVMKHYSATIPKSYLGVSPDLLYAAPMVGGMPQWAHKRPMADAVGYADRYNPTARSDSKIRLDVAWCGATGKWVAL